MNKTLTVKTGKKKNGFCQVRVKLFAGHNPIKRGKALQIDSLCTAYVDRENLPEPPHPAGNHFGNGKTPLSENAGILKLPGRTGGGKESGKSSFKTHRVMKELKEKGRSIRRGNLKT